jgi:class 3 adenylate cyclase
VGDRSTRIEEQRYIASRIPEARFVELPGQDHIFWIGGGEEPLADEIEEFVTGVRPGRDADRFLATILFTDIVNGTEKAAALGDRGWQRLIEQHHAAIRAELRRFRGTEVDTAGDGFFATFDGPARAVRCATASREAVRPLGIEIRAGVHTGECEIIAGKVGGLSVIIGARVKEQAGPGEVLVSNTVKDLVAGSGIAFTDRGLCYLKGVPGEWRLYAVTKT